MALRRSTLTLIFIYVILFFALCAKPISSVDQNNDGNKMTISQLEIAELERIKPQFGVKKSSVPQNECASIAVSMLEGFMPYIESWKSWFAAKGSCNLLPPEVKNCCAECQKILCDAVDGCKKSIDSINKQDIPKANCDINGIATTIQTCNDCFVQTPYGEDGDVKKLDVWAKQATHDCQDFLKTA